MVGARYSAIVYRLIVPLGKDIGLDGATWDQASPCNTVVSETSLPRRTLKNAINNLSKQASRTYTQCNLNEMMFNWRRLVIVWSATFTEVLQSSNLGTDVRDAATSSSSPIAATVSTNDAATPGKIRIAAAAKSRRTVERNEVQNTEGHRERRIVAGGFGGTPPSFMPPRKPAGASHSIHHEVNHRSLSVP